MKPILKILEIENLLNRLDFQHKNHKDLSESELVESLQIDCMEMDNMINRIYNYLESNIFSSLEFDELKRKTKKISEKLLDYTDKLIVVGSHRNAELEEFYKDVFFNLYRVNADSHTIINTNQVSELKEYLKDSIKPIAISPIKQQPIYNPNLWDKDSFELFLYLHENYYRGTIRQLTNIWFYLRERNYDNNTKKITKKDYKQFILSTYDIEIKNFDKAEEKYLTEKKAMEAHTINFQSI